jgi:hypothetical protein
MHYQAPIGSFGMSPFFKATFWVCIHCFWILHNWSMARMKGELSEMGFWQHMSMLASSADFSESGATLFSRNTVEPHFRPKTANHKFMNLLLFQDTLQEVLHAYCQAPSP